MDYKKACMMLAVLALLFALIAFSFANSINDNVNIYQIVENNTNLAPTIEPTVPGTGERIINITYTATNYPLQLLVFAHGSSVSQTAGTFVYINDTLVMPQSGRPLGGAEEAYRGVPVTVPKGSRYRVNFTNFHHYEWREYPILSGRNGTLSVNQTFITNITNTFNATYDQTTKEFNSNYTSQTFPNNSIYGLVGVLNSSKVNKTGDTMTGLLTGSAGINTTQINLTSNSYLYADTLTLGSQTINANTETLIKWHANTDTLSELKNNYNFTVLNSGNYYISSCAYVTGQKFGNRYYTRLRIADIDTVFFTDDYPSPEHARNDSTLCGNIIRTVNGGQNISVVIFTDATAGNTLTADARSFLTIQKVS